MSSVRELIDSSPMGRPQYSILILCTAIAMAEGFDILSMSLAVVRLADEWSLTGSQVGLFLAVGPIGIAVGSLAIGPLADRYGRRSLMVLSMFLLTACMGVMAFVQNAGQLMTVRVVSGLLMGALIPLIPLLIAEFAPASKKAMSIGIFAIGAPLGGAVGGAIGAILMSEYGWRALFAFGAAITLAMSIVALTLIPESPDYLMTKDSDKARAQLEQLVTKLKLNQPHKDAHTPVPFTPTRTVPGFPLLTTWRSSTTVVLTLAMVAVSSCLYFAQLWLPKILIAAGMSANQGIGGVVLFSLGSALGGLAFALISLRFATLPTAAIFIFSAAVLFAAFSFSTNMLTPAMLISILLGVCIQAAYAGLYSAVPLLFAADVRATAMGVAVGFGRVGMIATPLLIGVLVDGGWNAARIFLLMVAPALLAALLIIYLGASAARRRSEVSGNAIESTDHVDTRSSSTST